MNVVFEFLNFYLTLLLPNFLVYVVLLHSYPLKVSKKKGYIIGFACANLLPLSDTISLIFVGKRMISYTADVYWMLKFLNYLTSFVVLIFLFIVINKEWYYCYWWYLLLQILLLIPSVLIYQRAFVTRVDGLVQILSIRSELFWTYMLYVIITIILGLILCQVGKKLISKIAVYKLHEYIWYGIYILWISLLFVSDKEYADLEYISNYDFITNFAFFMCIIIFITITVYDKKVLKLENNMLKQKSEFEYEAYLNIQKQEDEIHKLYHDIGNHIETIKVLLERGDTKEAQIYSNTLSKKYIEIRNEYYCNNKIINAVLVKKARICKEEQINHEFNVKLVAESKIKDIDYMSIFANLLDNAIEACRRSKLHVKYIKLDVTAVGDYCVVKVVNSFEDSLMKKHNNTKTWKKNKKLHGYGKKIIHEIVQRYEGQLKFSHGDNVYEALLMVKYK